MTLNFRSDHNLWVYLVVLMIAVNFTHGKRIPLRYKNYTETPEYKALLESRIVGGEIAEDGFAPYQVSIQGTWGNIVCGGVVLDNRRILTAGHCVDDFPLEFLRVVAGTNRWKEPGETYELLKYVKHCNYDEPEFHNDIAVVLLKQTIEFTERIQPIALAERNPEPGSILLATGWGDLMLNGETPDDLQKVEVKYVPHEECKAAWDNYEGVGVGHICTLMHQGVGVCNGDSGGPVTYNGTLVGLVNWGKPCAANKPDMHASVVYYRDFIELAKSDCARLRG